jgi:GNAT superfamily N-acetyltransferase
MSIITDLSWDSKVFGVRTGRVYDYRHVPGLKDLHGYTYVDVRIPQESVNIVWDYQKIGFRFITLDYSLEKTPVYSQNAPANGYDVFLIRKQHPNFRVSGFRLQGSRLVIDPELNRHLNHDFWDNMVKEHCRDFADFCLCAVDSRDRLIGFVSCHDKTGALDMFLVLVLPDLISLGVGKTLIQAAESRALAEGKKLTTSVVANNLKAMNFYFRNGFIATQANVVLHYSSASSLLICSE